jgi:NAD(P)-dependent dehydrogenase (short-subunit alcohol dehydrogenase family)
MSGTILVTGASRGIGLEFVRQYAAAGWRVHAACRQPAGAAMLQALAHEHAGRVHVHPLEVTDGQQRARLAAALRHEPLDILLNNAGVWGGEGQAFGSSNEQEWLHGLRVNAIAPLLMMEAFADPVARSRRRLMANMSSRMGSIADNQMGGYYPYRSSKAALNMITMSAAIDLRPRGITCVVLHPGWVRTDMGGPEAEISPERSVTGLRAVLDRIGPQDSGAFFDYDGSRIPW